MTRAASELFLSFETARANDATLIFVFVRSTKHVSGAQLIYRARNNNNNQQSGSNWTMTSPPGAPSLSDEFDDEDELRLMEEEGEALFEEVEDRYYQRLRARLAGDGFRDPLLLNFHDVVDLSTQTLFIAHPRAMETYEDIPGTPNDHPLRAIAAVLDQAAPGSTVRVFAYSLTDVAAIDLLVHAGKTKTVQVLLQRSDATRKALKKWADEVGKVDILEHMEMRLASAETLGATSSKASLHVKAVVTTNLMAMGSYNLSKLARSGNLETLSVMPTEQSLVNKFDEIWNTALVCTNQVEKIYKELNYPLSPTSKRKRRYDAEDNRRRNRQRQAASAGLAAAAAANKNSNM